MSRRRRRNRHKQPWASPQGGPRVPGGAGSSPRSTSSIAKPAPPTPTVPGRTARLTREDVLKALTIDCARSVKPFGTVVFARAKGALVVACKAKSLPDAVELEQIMMGLMRQYCEAPKPVKGQAPPPMDREPAPLQVKQGRRVRPSAPRPAGALETVSPTGYGNRNDDDVEAAIAEGRGRRR